MKTDTVIQFLLDAAQPRAVFYGDEIVFTCPVCGFNLGSGQGAFLKRRCPQCGAKFERPQPVKVRASDEPGKFYKVPGRGKVFKMPGGKKFLHIPGKGESIMKEAEIIKTHTSAMVKRLNELTYGHHYFRLNDDGLIHLWDDNDIPFEENEPEDLGPIEPLETLRNLNNASEEQRVYDVISLSSFLESIDPVEAAISMLVEEREKEKDEDRRVGYWVLDLAEPLKPGQVIDPWDRSSGVYLPWSGHFDAPKKHFKKSTLKRYTSHNRRMARYNRLDKLDKTPPEDKPFPDKYNHLAKEIFPDTYYYLVKVEYGRSTKDSIIVISCKKL